MKKRHLLCLLLALLIALSGCSRFNQTPKTPADEPGSKDASGTIKDSQSTGSVESRIQEFTGDAEITENPEKAELSVETALEGNVKFDQDAASAVSFMYNADSSEDQTLTLKTPDGAVWSLVVPAHALLENTTITITPLKNINSSSLGGLQYGVLLEPDGLEFLKPAKLTLSADGLKEHPVLLGGNHDGSKLELAMVEKAEGGVSATLLHFSTAFGDPLDDDNKMTQVKNAASADYKEIRDLALEYLKKPISVPVPPAMSLRCPADHEEKYVKEMEKFMLLFNHPESSLAQELLKAARTEILLNDNEAAQEESLEIVRKLAKRLVKKADKLYDTYYPQEDYLKPVGNAALYAERSYILVGGEDDRHFIELIGEWVKKVADKFLDDLVKKHDYKAFRPALILGREAVIFGAQNDSFLQKLQDALQFEVQYEAEVKLTGDGTITYKTSGKAPYTMALFQFDKYYAKGQGQYDSFTSPEPQLTLKLPNSYKFETTIENFNPCYDKPIDIYIDKLGAKTETMIAGGYAAPPTQGVVQSTIGLLMNKDMVYDLKDRSGTMFYRFSCPLQNLNVNAADKTFTESQNGVSIKVTVRLVHTPQ